jgi:hypothetical protein
LWFARLFILPHTAVGLFLLLIVPVRLFVENWGTPVTATVDRVEPRTRKGHESHWISYHYLLNGKRYDGKKWQERAVVGETIEGRAAVLAGYEMFYTEAPSASGLLLVLAFALFWNGLLSVILYMAWVAPLRQRWLVREGVATIGTVTNKRIGRVKNNPYIVSYRFEVAGEEQTGECWVNAEAYERAHEGMPITVLFDPSRPQRSLPYELSDFVATP